MKTFHMKKMYKKVTAFILAITMIVAYIQIKAYAFDNNVSEITRHIMIWNVVLLLNMLI